MNTSTNASAARILAQQVSENLRLLALPKHFGAHMRSVELGIYDFMKFLSPDYSGGYWQFYELSNGGFYMAPTLEKLRVCVHGNHFDGLLSADAAGITACLFTYSHLSFRITSDMPALHYQLLLAFAAEHAEAGRILAAID